MSALAALAQDETPLLHFAGSAFQPLLSGGLYWPAEDALLVADLHLEKMSSFAARGSLLPPYDTAQTLRRLAADVAGLRPSTVIALGDSFHRDAGVSSLGDADRSLLATLVGQADWIFLSGNHDPAPHRLGGTCIHTLVRAGLTLAHHPISRAKNLICGHLHPAARVVINGRSVRRPCFAHDGATMILPAYGSGAGSINVLGPAFAPFLRRERLEVTMIGRARLYPVSVRRLVGGT